MNSARSILEMISKELRVASFNADALSLDAVHFPEILEHLPKMLNIRSAKHLPDLTVFKLQMDGEQLEKPGGTSPQVELSQGCVVIVLAFARFYNYR